MKSNDVMLNKHLFECTLGEFAQAVAFYLTKPQEEKKQVTPDLPKGLKGIQQIFNCSDYMARKIKQSGVIDSAIYVLGARVFVTDPEKAKRLYESCSNKPQNLSNHDRV